MKEKYQSHGWTTLGSLKQRRAKLDELLSARCFPCQISLHFPRNNRRSSATFRARLHPSRWTRNLNVTRAIRLIRIETFYARSTKKKKKKKRRRRKKKKWRRKREGGGSTGICKAVGESPNAGTDARHREQIFLPRDEDRRNHRFPLCRGIFNLKGAISSGDDPCLPLLLDRVSIVPLKRMMEERI